MNFIKKHKKYVIAGSILLIYLVVMYFIAYRSDILDKQTADIIIDGINGWRYEDRQWNNIYDYEYLDDDNYFKVYSHNHYYGEYTLRVNNNSLYAFDTNYDSLQYEGSLMAYSSNYDINVFLFDYEMINDNDRLILNDIINSNLNYNMSANKVIVDLDNDESLETIYILNFYDDTDYVTFSGIYVYDEELEEVIVGEYLTSFEYNVCYILDIDEDNKYELVLSSLYYNNLNYSVYKDNGKGYELYLQ